MGRERKGPPQEKKWSGQSRPLAGAVSCPDALPLLTVPDDLGLTIPSDLSPSIPGDLGSRHDQVPCLPWSPPSPPPAAGTVSSAPRPLPSVTHLSMLVQRPQ